MDSTNTNTAKKSVDVDVQIEASRAVRAWLNTAPCKPCQIGMEYLPDDYGMALTVTETPYKVKQYIGGGYLAAYECDIVYRCTPVTDDERMKADEDIDRLAVWAVNNSAALDIAGARLKRVQRTTPAVLTARYSTGAEDHSVHLIIQFEVINHG